MSRSGIQVETECIDKFNELKLKKKIKFIIFKISENSTHIEVEDSSENTDWEFFREKLINATSKSKSGAVAKGPRYAVYDFSYDLPNGEGSRSKITFIAWSPDDAGVQSKMIYASSKESLKRALNGVAAEVQGNDPDDIEYDAVYEKLSKGK